jgi:citrate lyase subunit beta/citryl-CoA lyase
MKYRSWLIVPGNSEKRLGLAMGTGADVVVVDLEDSVPDHARTEARELACEWLAVHRQNVLEYRKLGRWARIGPIDSGHSREDLQAVMPAAPDGIIMTRAAGPDDVRQLASEIYELEQRHGIPANSTRIMPVVGDTPRAAMRIGDYLDTTHQRLHGLTWSASGLSAAIGGSRLRTQDGGWTDACRFVRAQTLLAACGSQIMAIDAPFESLEDEQGLITAACDACADGFAGMFAVHPEQIPAINAAFTPNAEEVAHAQGLIDAFDENPLTAALSYDGRMVDRTHLAMAQRMVARGETEQLAEAQRRSAILRPA